MKKQTIKVFTCEKCFRQFIDEKTCKEHEAGCTYVKVHPEILHLAYRQGAVNREPELHAHLSHRPVRRTDDEFPVVDLDVNIEFNIVYNYGTTSLGDALERVKNQLLEVLVEASKRISTITTENVVLPRISREEYDVPSEGEESPFIEFDRGIAGLVQASPMRPGLN